MKTTYTQKLKDPRWQKKRLEVMARDGFSCMSCHHDVETLHVHHCHYERGNPWDTPAEFLTTLCAQCHEDREDLELNTRRDLGYIFANASEAQRLDIVRKIHQAAQKVRVQK